MGAVRLVYSRRGDGQGREWISMSVARCKRCGKWKGVFQMHNYGLCRICHEEALGEHQEEQRQERLEREAERFLKEERENK